MQTSEDLKVLGLPWDASQQRIAQRLQSLFTDISGSMASLSSLSSAVGSFEAWKEIQSQGDSTYGRDGMVAQQHLMQCRGGLEKIRDRMIQLRTEALSAASDLSCPDAPVWVGCWAPTSQV